MDIISNVINYLKLSTHEIEEIQTKTNAMSLSESNKEIINILLSKIEKDYEDVNENVAIIFFIKKFAIQRIFDSQTRISIYDFLLSLDYGMFTPVDIASKIEAICEERPKYRKYCYSILLQLSIPHCFIRMACVALLNFQEKQEDIIEKLTECIKSDCNVIDKFYCLSLLNIIYSSIEIEVTFDPFNYCQNDISLLDTYIEDGFCLLADRCDIEDNEKAILNELGKTILSGNMKPYFRTVVHKEKEKVDLTRKKQNDDIFGDISSVVDIDYNSYYVSEYNGIDFRFKYTEIINNDVTIRCRRLTSDDYLCMIALISFNYDDCLKYYSKNTNKLLLTKVASVMLNIQNPVFPDILISFIADVNNFDVKTRIRLAYCFKNPDNMDYLTQCHTILKSSFYSMENSEKEKVNNLIR